MTRLTVLVLSVVMLSATNLFAQEDAVKPEAVSPEGVLSTDSMAPAAGEAPAAEEGPVMVNNKRCPVSGEEVGTMGEPVQVEHNGKIYNLCCAGCKKDFQKDPEKYAAIADEEVAVPEVEMEVHEEDVE